MNHMKKQQLNSNSYGLVIRFQKFQMAMSYLSIINYTFYFKLPCLLLYNGMFSFNKFRPKK